MVALLIESWIWFAVTTCLVVARLVSRALLFRSIKKLQTDDWLMVLALATYTTVIVTINIVANHNSNLLPPGFDASKLTPQEIAERRFGSKIILVVEQAQCATIWLTKACLLFMYYRLT
jgi:cytosine/uracil/thiamine/allantoin permease